MVPLKPVWNLRRCLHTQNTAYLVIYWLGSEAANQLPLVSDIAYEYESEWNFPSQNALSSSGPPCCHAYLICCRSNYLYCFVGSFISSPNSLAPSSLSLCLTVCCGSECLLTLQVCVVYLICCRRRGDQINGCSIIQTTAQQHSNEKTHRHGEGGKKNSDKLRKEMGERTQCVQILLKVCKLSLFVPQSLMLKVSNFSLAI